MGSTSDRPYLVLVGAMAMFAGFSAYHLAPSSIIPVLVEHFGFEQTDTGLAISAVYIGWLLFQLPSGYLMDRFDNRWLMAIAVIVFVASAVVSTFTSTYLEFLIVRVISGMTGGLIFAMNAAIVGQIFPSHRQGFATTLYVSSGPAGVALGHFASPVLVNHVPWPTVFFSFAALALIGYVAFHVGFSGGMRSGSPLSLSEFKRALTHRSVLIISMAGLCTNALFLFLISWMPLYGLEVLSLSLTGAGLLSALAPVAGILGRPSGGWVSDRIGRRRRPVIIVSFVLVLPLIFVIPSLHSATNFALVLFIAGFSLQLGAGLYYIYVQELGEQHVTGTSVAVMTTFVIVGGMSGPVIGGWLINSASWVAAFGFFGGISVIGLAFVLLGGRSG